MDVLSPTQFALIAGFITILIIYVKHKFDYWKNRNIPYLNALILKDVANTFNEPYENFKFMGHKYFGTFSFGKPMLVLIDLDAIKQVLSTDFQYFNSRGVYHNEKDDPLTANLFNLSGDKWRNLRVKLTPTFTSGKMKMMFQTLLNCGQLMENHLTKTIKEETCIDIKEIACCFTTDVIGSIAFGLECNSFEEDKSAFRKYGKKIIVSNLKDHVRRQFTVMFPNLSRKLHIKLINEEVSDFFTKAIKDVVNYRQSNNCTRKDFLQLLIDLKNNKLKEDQKASNDTITFNELTAQAFVFFVAGFETSSTTMSFCLYELAINQDIQDKVRTEIKKTLSENGGAITYENVNEMKYLGQVIDETLRKYPPLANLIRKCVKDYKIPDTNLTVEKDVSVLIPVYQLHHDPEYFLNPEKFDPERFSSENKLKIPKHAYLPFGDGPRNCIGLRFGILQAKVGLIALLNKFRFTLNEKTPAKLLFKPTSFVLAFEEIVYLNANTIKE